MPKKLIVTGAAGFIASTYVRQRLAAGDSILVIDNLTYAGHLQNLDTSSGFGCRELALANGCSFDFVKGSINDGPLIESIMAEFSPDAVLNFAAESHVDNSIANPSQFIDTNIRGTYELLNKSLSYFKSGKNSAGSRFRFLHVSTDEVFGSLGPTGFFSESTPYAPNSPYSASKAASDHLVRAWFHTYGLPTLTTNCSNNYGPRQFPEKLIPLMISHALSGKSLPVYGDGGNIRDWIHVEDHCKGIHLALELGTPGETYCFGGNAERNNLQVVNAICKELNSRAPRADGKGYEQDIQFVKDRLGHDRRYAIDDTKAQKELGFQREHNFESGLKATIDWYLSHQSWCQAVLKKH